MYRFEADKSASDKNVLGMRIGVKKIYGIIRAVILLAICMLSFVVCASCKSGDKDTNSYAVYYKSSSGYKLVEVMYEAAAASRSELAAELIEQMNVNQKQSDISVVKPPYVVYEKVEVNDKIANIYFSKGYNDMDNVTEVLYRAALVKTVTQIEGIKYVQIYVGNSAATYSNGIPLGLVSAEDFVDDEDEALISVEWKEINLYYANKLGDKLVKKQETIAYSKNVSLEKMVMEKLIKGPSDDNMSATLPANLKLLSITVNEGVCYVNLDSAFLTEMVNVSNEIPIYSIANSLCSLTGINSVRIMINGDTAKTFRESISLDDNFKFKSSLIEY